MTTRGGWARAAAPLALLIAACGDDGPARTASGPDTLEVGAALSLTGKLAREGVLTREGYQYCEEVVNAKGGVEVGGGPPQELRITYQDDQSTPDVAAQLVDGFNDRGIRVLLGPYGSASTEAAAAVARFGTAADYAAGVKARFGHDPEYHNAEATAACLALVLAMEQANSADPAKVRDALAGLDVETFFGRIRFDEEGKNADKPMAVIQIQDGKAVTVWPRSEHTASLRWPAGAP